jgi:cell division protein FtsB
MGYLYLQASLRHTVLLAAGLAATSFYGAMGSKYGVTPKSSKVASTEEGTQLLSEQATMQNLLAELVQLRAEVKQLKAEVRQVPQHAAPTAAAQDASPSDDGSHAADTGGPQLNSTDAYNAAHNVASGALVTINQTVKKGGQSQSHRRRGWGQYTSSGSAEYYYRSSYGGYCSWTSWLKNVALEPGQDSYAHWGTSYYRYDWSWNSDYYTYWNAGICDSGHDNCQYVTTWLQSHYGKCVSLCLTPAAMKVVNNLQDPVHSSTDFSDCF